MKIKRKKKSKSGSTAKRIRANLDKMAAEFDQEFIADTFDAPSTDVKNRFRRAKRKPGRPKVGAGSKAISVTVEKTLLKKIDRIAKRKKTTRAEIIASGLKAFLHEEETANA
jgi:hypothetical protein